MSTHILHQIIIQKNPKQTYTYSPQAPPTEECLSKHFHSSYIDVPVGFVPTSSKIQTSKQSESDKMTPGKKRTIWVDQWTKSVEEPPVAIQLFLVLFFETKYNLHWTCALRHLASFCDNDAGGISTDQLHKSSNDTRRDLLEYMRCDVSACYGILSNTFLIATHLQNQCSSPVAVQRAYQREYLQRAFVYFVATIRNNADDDLFPAFRAPCFGATSGAEMRDVFYDAIFTVKDRKMGKILKKRTHS